MPARLQTLGHLRLLDEGGNDIVFPEKALLILCYLRTRGINDMPRADAAGLFWDDANGTAAFASLRQFRPVQEFRGSGRSVPASCR